MLSFPSLYSYACRILANLLKKEFGTVCRVLFIIFCSTERTVHQTLQPKSLCVKYFYSRFSYSHPSIFQNITQTKNVHRESNVSHLDRIITELSLTPPSFTTNHIDSLTWFFSLYYDKMRNTLFQIKKQHSFLFSSCPWAKKIENHEK